MTPARSHLGVVLPMTSLRAMQSSQPSFFSVSTLCMAESGRKEKKLNLTFYFVAGSIIRINEGPELIASHADSSHQQRKLQRHWPHETWTAVYTRNEPGSSAWWKELPGALRQLESICKIPGSRRSDTLLWLPLARDIHVVCRHTCRQSPLAHEMNKSILFKIMKNILSYTS